MHGQKQIMHGVTDFARMRAENASPDQTDLVRRYAVILAGGSGERLWPLSTPERPKQFVKIFGGKSLIRQALERVLPLVPVENVLVVTAKSLERATREELPELPRGNLLLGPVRQLDCRNCSLVSEGVRISAFGLDEVVVATRGNEVLVMSAARAAELKSLISG